MSKNGAQKHKVERALCALYPPEWLRKAAKQTGFVKRERKIDPALFFWVLVLGFGVRLQRSFASLRRGYEKSADTRLSSSGFYYRFTPETVSFFHAAVLRGIEALAQEPSRALKERLASFKDLVIQDSTVVRLHKLLVDKWPAARTRVVAAGIKVSVLVSVIADGPKNVRIFGERTSEQKTIRIGPWVKDRILLLDLGFFKYQLFSRIERNGGYFISRLKDNADPLIVGVNKIWRGRAVPLAGMRLRDVLPRIKRGVLDAEVEVGFSRRAYRGGRSSATEALRLVAVYDKEDKAYHLYLTNIPLGRMSAEDVALLYGARWEVELIFKELKSVYALDELPTANSQAVEALVWVSIVTLIVSRRIYTLVRAKHPDMALRYTHMRWAKIFAENASDLRGAILAYAGISATMMELYAVFDSHALDPNINRERLMEDWVA